MKLNKLTINQKLGAIALLLALVALLMPDPLRSKNVMLNTKLLSQKINEESSKISVTELADYIIQGKADFILIDLSDAKHFDDYHIPSAINLKVEELNTDNITRNKKIILCSNDNLKTAQVWFLLKADKYNFVYMLDGGLDAWKSKILFPVIPDKMPSDKIAEFDKIKAISKYFGGNPQISGVDSNASKPMLSMPRLASAPSSAPAATGWKKPKKEGC